MAPTSSLSAAPSQPVAAAPKKLQPLPFHYQFLAGGIAGTSEILIMYPLDVVKTRFQLQTSSAGGTAYTSIFDSFQRIIKEEGFGRLYRGIVPPIMMEAPKRAIKFATNEQYGRIVGDSGLFPSSIVPLISGTMAGCTEAFVVVPFDLVKIRLQDRASAGKYKNTVDCVQKIIAEEGVFAFYKGMGSTLWRHGVWSGAYFGSIGYFKNVLKNQFDNQTTLNFFAGLLGGTFGTLLNTPFDVIKTRVQNNVYKGSTLGGLVFVAKREGPRALWKGFVPKVLRLGPGGGIMLVMFDTISTWIRNNLM